MSSFNQNIKRLGTVCIITDDNHKNIATIGKLTQTSLKAVSKVEQYKRIVSKLKQNLSALQTQLKWIATQPAGMRLFRISSNLLPMHDHPELSHPYQDSDVLLMVNNALGRIGVFCRNNDIRIATHPDQFCIINSHNPEVVDNALHILRSHQFIAEAMGYGGKFQDFTINIHLNGRTDTLPIEDMDNTLKRMITFENDEKKGTTERVLDVCNRYGLTCLYDIHHDWCNRGDYSVSDSSSKLLQDVIATWRGVRPLFHISQPTEDVWSCNNTLPCRDDIVSRFNKSAPYKHSDYISNTPLIGIVCHMHELGDIEVEAKTKNHAVLQLFNQINA